MEGLLHEVLIGGLFETTLLDWIPDISIAQRGLKSSGRWDTATFPPFFVSGLGVGWSLHNLSWTKPTSFP